MEDICSEGSIGQFCECSIGEKDERTLRASCQRHNGTECEGRGDFVCGRCQCHTTESGSSYHGYEGSACQCKVSEEGCRTLNNTVCYDRGTCKCNRCECKEGYQHPRCHTCLGCPDPCQTKLYHHIASVALIGNLLLMLIKLLIYMKDIKEFRTFENEKKKSKWAEADNPLFQTATTTVSNPTFTGE
ncbi:hypothetical protein NQZ68_028795 [Dissostichus eleginoides]|nr:hypothetical protein NQZ68_028795 [Dissostichus eleginoides]